MGGEGSIQSMITILKNNKLLLRPKRSFLNQKKEFVIAAKGELNLKKASKEDLERIREKIYKERKKQRTIGLAIGSILLVIIIYSGVLLSNHLSELGEASQQHEFNQHKTEYLELIKDGDMWLEKRSWHNSIFQYKKALDIFPNEYDINYRLTYAYCLRCEDEYKNCKEAKEHLDKLLEKFPDKTELLELRKMLKYEY